MLERNRAWAERQMRADPELFNALAQGQQPETMWIGCSDSRVSPNLIMDLAPGEVFVHRNVANQFVPGDLSSLAALQFAVEVLRVRRVVVGGHYACGGVVASMKASSAGPTSDWLEPLRSLWRSQPGELASFQGETLVRRLCELNVIEQVGNVAATAIVSDAWRAGEDVAIHGLIYDIGNGRLRPICRQARKGGLVIDGGRPR